MAGIHVVDHPLVQHKISLLRDKMTGVKEFRELTSETAMLICYEATRDLPMKEITIETYQGIAKTKPPGKHVRRPAKSMVPPARFERATPALGERCSIP